MSEVHGPIRRPTAQAIIEELLAGYGIAKLSPKEFSAGIIKVLSDFNYIIVDKEMTDEQIKQMRDRFLVWQLPYDFKPDNGITFDPIGSRGTPHEFRRKPVGTNLLTAVQVEEMIRYILDGVK